MVGNNLKKASFWDQKEDNFVQCKLCPNCCLIPENGKGKCRKRHNIDGILYTETYGNICAEHIDPIEKKPLYHFYPGTEIYSVGCNSCNLKCQFCQNYDISQKDTYTVFNSPEQLVKKVIQSGCSSLAFTYSEPLMMIEYIIDCLPLLNSAGIKTVMVSNGYINKEPLQLLLPHISAWNVDLKSFHNKFYNEICSAEADVVKENITEIAKYAHLEISFLVIPELNDSIEETIQIAEFIAQINPDIPLHINRYHPAYKINYPPTPIKTMIELYNKAKEYLNNVYLGNTGINEYNQTLCSHCHKVVLSRTGYGICVSRIKDQKCTYCNQPVYGLF